MKGLTIPALEVQKAGSPLSLTGKFDGIVHFVDGRETYASRGRRIFASDNEGKTWKPLVDLPLGPWEKFRSCSRLARRLWRGGVHHVIKAQGGRLVVFAVRAIFVVDPLSGEVVRSNSRLCGSRPLALCRTRDGRLFYGEYRSNPERTPVHVHCSRDGGLTWAPVYAFSQVRHIHGVYEDPFTGDLWAATGDTDREAGLWVSSDGFRTAELVVGGRQQFRAVVLLFAAEHIYFGSDSPEEPNFLYRMDRRSAVVERLQAVEGSVMSGRRLGEWIFFGTACEPSRVNRASHAAMWASRDGTRWERVMIFSKDALPPRLFQYGQVKFPEYSPRRSDSLWLTPFATEGDQMSWRYSL